MIKDYSFLARLVAFVTVQNLVNHYFFIKTFLDYYLDSNI